MKTFAFIALLSLASGCARQGQQSSNAASVTSSNATPIDLHSDSNIIIRRSSSQYEESLKIAGDWDGGESYFYTLECESCSIERLLRFLHRDADFSDPKIFGAEHIPHGLYSVAFPKKQWRSKEDVIQDVTEALEVAFGLDVAADSSSHSITIKKRN
jgi:hypothetical protein